MDKYRTREGDYTKDDSDLDDSQLIDEPLIPLSEPEKKKLKDHHCRFNWTMKIFNFLCIVITIYEFFYTVIYERPVKGSKNGGVLEFVLKILFDLLFAWIFCNMYTGVKNN